MPGSWRQKGHETMCTKRVSSASATEPARRPRSAPLDNDLRHRLAVALSTERPERIATRADVSVATVLRARNGAPVSPLVRNALALALDAGQTSR